MSGTDPTWSARTWELVTFVPVCVHAATVSKGVHVKEVCCDVKPLILCTHYGLWLVVSCPSAVKGQVCSGRGRCLTMRDASNEFNG